jgi:hypothetical protein
VKFDEEETEKIKIVRLSHIGLCAPNKEIRVVSEFLYLVKPQRTVRNELF